MPKWVSVFENPPTKMGWYFVKHNGNKKLVHFDEFQKLANNCETFLYLDETDDERNKINELVAIDNIDDFCKANYKVISQKLIVPYAPYIPKSIVINSFHKYYLRIIASLRKEVSILSKAQINNCMVHTTKKKETKIINGDNQLDKINKLLTDNSFF